MPATDLPISDVAMPPDTGQPRPDADLDLPITICKGARGCAKHPISKSVNYSRISPHYRTFLFALSYASISTSFYEVVKYPIGSK